jgi:hypothetical protein
VALAATVRELDGHAVLYDAEILAPGVTALQIPEYEGRAEEQDCDAARVAQVNSNADTNNSVGIMW